MLNIHYVHVALNLSQLEVQIVVGILLVPIVTDVRLVIDLALLRRRWRRPTLGRDSDDVLLWLIGATDP